MNPGLKVAIVGTYSSGKTTLTQHLMAALHPNAVLIEEKPRRIIAIGGNGLMRNSAIRDHLIVSQLIDEAERNDDRRTLIADGGIVNNLAHDILFLSPVPDRASLLRDLRFRPYDLALWTDFHDVPLEDDGERFTSDPLRRELDEHVATVLLQLRVPSLRISGNQEERLRQALIFLSAAQSLRSEQEYKGSRPMIKSGAILVRDGKVLAVRKKDHQEGPLILLGGKLEKGETPEQCLRREVMEETGAEVCDLVPFADYWDMAEFEDIPLLVRTFVVRVRGPLRPRDEISDLVWVGPADRAIEAKASILGTRLIPDLLRSGLL